MMNSENTPDPRMVYADIIDLPHHQSEKHPHMSLHDRAAQFAPFAALTGYDEIIGEETRLTDLRITPGESDLEQLDRAFRRLSDLLSAKQRPKVSVLVFVSDSRKSGGHYETVAGRAKKLDLYAKRLILLGECSPAGEISLDMDRILDLSGPFTEDPA